MHAILPAQSWLSRPEFACAIPQAEGVDQSWKHVPARLPQFRPDSICGICRGYIRQDKLAPEYRGVPGHRLSTRRGCKAFFVVGRAAGATAHLKPHFGAYREVFLLVGRRICTLPQILAHGGSVCACANSGQTNAASSAVIAMRCLVFPQRIYGNTLYATGIPPNRPQL